MAAASTMWWSRGDWYYPSATKRRVAVTSAPMGSGSCASCTHHSLGDTPSSGSRSSSGGYNSAVAGAGGRASE
eukprot:SAG25_NODE_6048_length_593_cov_1.668016_1_plen_72_part_01